MNTEEPTLSAHLSIRFAPAKPDRLKVSFAKIEGRIETDVERTRKRSIILFVVGAAIAALSAVVSVATSFEASKRGVGITLAVIAGAFATVALGSAIGLLLSLPDKRQRQANIKDLMDALNEGDIHGNRVQDRQTGGASGSPNG